MKLRSVAELHDVNQNGRCLDLSGDTACCFCAFAIVDFTNSN